MKLLIITSLFFLSSLSVAADDKSSSNPLSRCREMDNYVAAGGCAAEVAEKAGEKLDATYETLLNELNASEGKKLHNAQRKWIAYRDADCDFSSPLKANPDVKESSDRAYCVAEKTLARIKELQDIINWPVGCNGCPF